jgi:hypothetical protein
MLTDSSSQRSCASMQRQSMLLHTHADASWCAAIVLHTFLRRQPDGTPQLISSSRFVEDAGVGDAGLEPHCAHSQQCIYCCLLPSPPHRAGQELTRSSYMRCSPTRHQSALNTQAIISALTTCLTVTTVCATTGAPWQSTAKSTGATQTKPMERNAIHRCPFAFF